MRRRRGYDHTTTTEEERAATETVEVTAVDYAYEGLPDEIDAGTQLTLANTSAAELHELEHSNGSRDH